MDKTQQYFESHAERLGKIVNKVEENEEWQKKEDESRREEIHVLYDMLDKQLPRWREKYDELLGIGPRPLTKEELEKVEGFLERLRANPDTDNVEDDD